MALERPVVGTGFLRQFLATLDYPCNRLVLRPRGSSAPEGGAKVPFALAASHLLLARGSLDDLDALTSSSTLVSRTRAVRPSPFPV